MTAVERVVRHLQDRGRWTYSRASGPGGQRRDHAETRAELTVDVDSLTGLSPAMAARLRDGLSLDVRALRLRCGTERSREQNRDIVIARLRRRIEAALAAPPPPRVATRPSRAAKERRLAGKKQRSTTKATRGRVDPTGD